MKCDLCEKEGSTTNLVASYQTEKVKKVCSECLGILNVHLDNAQKLQSHTLQTLMKRSIRMLRAKKLKLGRKYR